MEKLLKYLFYLSLLSIAVGPLGVIPTGVTSVNLYLSDIFVASISFVLIAKLPVIINLIKEDKTAIYFLIFVAVGLISLIISPITLTISERLISGLYLIRLAAYFSVYLSARHLIKQKIIRSQSIVTYLTIVSAILMFLSWIQYAFYPNLRNLFYLGWDPHLKRIFASYLDPNYFGLIMVLALIIIKPPVLRLIGFVTLMFTYSRSSYMAFLSASIFYSILRKKYLLIGGVLVLLLISAGLLPRSEGIGVRLERVFSLVERVENWRQGIKMFTINPIVGTGFNTIRYAKRQYGISDADLLVSHAGAGFDNSFIFIAVSTGIAGLLIYLVFLREAYISGSFLAKMSLVAIVIHSMFLNSLFFPWVMLWMWAVLAYGE